MDDEQNKIKEYGVINIKLPLPIHKALQYARIETRTTNEKLVIDALKAHLLKLGFLKVDGEVNKPETTKIEEV